ncbi:unnamed protein product [Caenorhabditis brenneri]
MASLCLFSLFISDASHDDYDLPQPVKNRDFQGHFASEEHVDSKLLVPCSQYGNPVFGNSKEAELSLELVRQGPLIAANALEREICKNFAEEEFEMDQALGDWKDYEYTRQENKDLDSLAPPQVATPPNVAVDANERQIYPDMDYEDYRLPPTLDNTEQFQDVYGNLFNSKTTYNYAFHFPDSVVNQPSPLVNLNAVSPSSCSSEISQLIEQLEEAAHNDVCYLEEDLNAKFELDDYYSNEEVENIPGVE